MGKYYKLWLLRLLWRPVSLGFSSFPPSSTDSEKCRTIVYLSPQYSFSGQSSTAQFRTELGTLSCVCCLLHGCFDGVLQEVSGHPMESPGGRVLSLVRLLRAGMGGNPLSNFPEARLGVTGARQKGLCFFSLSSFLLKLTQW